MYSFDFSYNEYEMLLKRCGFSDEEKQVLEMRRRGKSVVEISMALSLSERTVNRRIKSISLKIAREIYWR